MIIEYVENGQVMYYDPSTHRFTSKLTSIASVAALAIDGVLPEDHAKKYLYDIVSGLQYLHSLRGMITARYPPLPLTGFLTADC